MRGRAARLPNAALIPTTSVVTSHAQDRSWLRLARNVGLVFFLVAVFGAVEHDTLYANAAITTMSEKEIRDLFIEQMERGNALRQVALLALGCVGVAGMASSREKPWNVRWSVLAPLVVLVALSCLSIAWTPQPVVTAKRLVVLACVLTGCAGLARILTPREFLGVSLATLLLFISGSIAVDMAAGGRPWSGDYRFGGTLHPNAQATYCAILAIAANCLPLGFGRRWLKPVIIAAALGLIVLTESRTGLMAAVAALVLTWMVKLPPGMRWAGFSLGIAGATLLVVAYFSVGSGARSRVVDTALLGRSQQAGSLTGRLPLWDELLDHAADKPLLGYGYEGFWTKKRIAAIMRSQGWSLQNAHNSYFEILLQLGYVGLFLAIWFLIAGSTTLAAATTLTRDPGYAFAFGVVMFGVLNSGLESLFVKLRYSPVIAMIGLLMVALYYPLTSSDEPESRLPQRRVF